MEWVTEYILPRWPFVVVVCVLWVIGHFMETSVFTKTRALEHHPKRTEAKRSFAQKLHHWLFYWSRESMELHPIAAGAVIGMLWQNPEHADPAWSWAASVGYFAGAGFASLFGWIIITRVLNRVGIDTSDIRLPGESLRPEPPTGKPEPKDS